MYLVSHLLYYLYLYLYFTIYIYILQFVFIFYNLYIYFTISIYILQFVYIFYNLYYINIDYYLKNINIKLMVKFLDKLSRRTNKKVTVE